LSRVDHKDLNKKSLESLTKSGALDSLGLERNIILHNMEEILKFSALRKKEKQNAQIGLFAYNAFSAAKALKLKEVPPVSHQDKLNWEKELLGLYVSDHPLSSYLHKINAIKSQPIKAVLAAKDENQYHQVAGLISKIQKVITKTGKPMLFAKLEDFNDTLEVIVFSDTLLNNPTVWLENNVVAVTGRLSLKNGEPKLICEKVASL